MTSGSFSHSTIRKSHFFLIVLCCLFAGQIQGQQKISLWDRFEASYNCAYSGNVFTNVRFTATFRGPDTTFVVPGFYDSNNTFKLRFMPQKAGKWNFVTHSNIAALNNKKGSFECIKADANNHGLVKVSSDSHNFTYADGIPYYPFGTTAYAWTHMGNALQEMTLQSLRQSGFNKVRMCIFPKNYDLVKEEPELYPFEIKSVKKDTQGKEVKEWDFTRFNPAFFQHIEKRIEDLGKLGIEADLILFHPYDKGRWGFDNMPNEVNIRYINYLLARISSYHNVWWSIANEWDLVKYKTHADWELLSRSVHDADPYRHLCSIHGATATYYEYWEPWFSHVSIQDEAPVITQGAANILRNAYQKPIICDEVGYEGNLKQRWGRYSPEEMTHLVWNGIIGGIYVTHGETYMSRDDQDTIFWAKGGALKGESWKRIAFLRKLVEASPGAWQPADKSRDIQTAVAGKNYFIVYFGQSIVPEWTFNLPVRMASFGKIEPGTRYKVEIIDTWDMTIKSIPGIFESTAESDYRVYDKNQQKIRLPLKPYMALRITAIN
jgi:hypothetical protein